MWEAVLNGENQTTDSSASSISDTTLIRSTLPASIAEYHIFQGLSTYESVLKAPSSPDSPTSQHPTGKTQKQVFKPYYLSPR